MYIKVELFGGPIEVDVHIDGEYYFTRELDDLADLVAAVQFAATRRKENDNE